ncbi:MAG: substrate-binding domain-containing protein [Anaeroplasma sp.]
MKKIFGLFALTLCFLSGAVGLSSCNKTEEIKVYTRDTDSGTREGFFEGIGFSSAKKSNDDLVEGYITIASNGDMITGVKGDEYGIGYISLSSLESSGVKGLIYENVAPTEENVINGSYKLTRNFNYCIRASYSNNDNKDIVEAFVAYMSTKEGKATIQSKGGILTVESTDKSWNDIKNNYPIAAKDNSSVTINIGGSTSVNSIVKALLVEFSAKCGNFKYIHNATGSSDAYKRTNGSEKDGVNACDLAFASREFNQDEQMDNSLKGKMCTDAIVAIVNNDNRIDKVTAETLKNIYNGTYTTWDQVK